MDEARDPQLAFHRRIAEQNLAALWVARRGVDLTRPRSEAKPALWRYGDIRPTVMEAGAIVTAAEAFRRVLVLENPAFKEQRRVTNTLYAGLQLVLPGELAPCHRHTQTAIRFVLEGEGAFTSVDGERTRLHPGDFVITAAWTWHDHVNDGREPVVWLDCLDTPLVDFLNLAFRESYAEERHPVLRPDDDAQARYGAAMLPVGHVPERRASPIMNYRYGRSRAALGELARTSRCDPCDGVRLRYSDPATGGWPTPTVGTFLQYLPKGFSGAPLRVTDGTVYVAVEGRGRTIVDGVDFAWGPKDIFVVPGWCEFRHLADEDSVLFSLSDRPVQEALGLWREERPSQT